MEKIITLVRFITVLLVTTSSIMSSFNVVSTVMVPDVLSKRNSENIQTVENVPYGNEPDTGVKQLEEVDSSEPELIIDSSSVTTFASITFIEGENYEPIVKAEDEVFSPITIQSKEGIYYSEIDLEVFSDHDSEIATGALGANVKVSPVRQAHRDDVTMYEIIMNGETGWINSLGLKRARGS